MALPAFFAGGSYAPECLNRSDWNLAENSGNGAIQLAILSSFSAISINGLEEVFLEGRSDDDWAKARCNGDGFSKSGIASEVLTCRC